jgi:hypothetical protein
MSLVNVNIFAYLLFPRTEVSRYQLLKILHKVQKCVCVCVCVCVCACALILKLDVCSFGEESFTFAFSSL